MLFNKFESRIIVKGEIRTIDPIHIGTSSESIDPLVVDSSVLKDQNGMPVIPASSLKGVLRSFMESIQASGGLNFCSEDKSNINCFITDSTSNCINKNKYDEIKEKNKNSKDMQKQIALDVYNQSCIVCRLFGNGYMAAKVQIKDLKFIGNDPHYSIRNGVGIDRDTNTSSDSAKYDYEILSSGAKFDFYLVADNLTENESKALDFMMNVLKSGDVSVGAYTSRGFGRIVLEKFENDKINISKIVDHYTKNTDVKDLDPTKIEETIT